MGSLALLKILGVEEGKRFYCGNEEAGEIDGRNGSRNIGGTVSQE